jgi:hypothetical protein
VTVRPEHARAELELAVPARATISVAGAAGVEVQLPAASTAREVSRSSHAVPPSRPEYVEMAEGTDPVVVLRGTRPARVCGLGEAAE